MGLPYAQYLVQVFTSNLTISSIYDARIGAILFYLQAMLANELRLVKTRSYSKARKEESVG